MMVLIELSPSYFGPAFQNSNGEACHVYIPELSHFIFQNSLSRLISLLSAPPPVPVPIVCYLLISNTFPPVQEDSIERITPSDDVPYRLYFIFSRNHDAENQKSIEKKNPKNAKKCANK